MLEVGQENHLSVLEKIFGGFNSSKSAERLDCDRPCLETRISVLHKFCFAVWCTTNTLPRIAVAVVGQPRCSLGGAGGDRRDGLHRASDALHRAAHRRAHHRAHRALRLLVRRHAGAAPVGRHRAVSHSIT